MKQLSLKMSNKEEIKENQRDIEEYNELIENPNVLFHLYEPKDQNIRLCAEYINQGDIVGIPTETVYGLSADAFNVEAF